MEQSVIFLNFLRTGWRFFLGLAIFLVSFPPVSCYAKDYDYGCPQRNPRIKPTVEELADYVHKMEIIFEGKPVSQNPLVLGFLVTKFEVKSVISGKRPENNIIELVHTPDMFKEPEATYFIRAWRGNDNNLYPEGMSCPKYYTDQEIVDYFRYYWHKFFLGLFILLIGVYAAYKYFARDNEITQRFTWLRR